MSAARSHLTGEPMHGTITDPAVQRAMLCMSVAMQSDSPDGPPRNSYVAAMYQRILGARENPPPDKAAVEVIVIALLSEAATIERDNMDRAKGVQGNEP